MAFLKTLFLAILAVAAVSAETDDPTITSRTINRQTEVLVENVATRGNTIIRVGSGNNQTVYNNSTHPHPGLPGLPPLFDLDFEAFVAAGVAVGVSAGPVRGGIGSP